MPAPPIPPSRARSIPALGTALAALLTLPAAAPAAPPSRADRPAAVLSRGPGALTLTVAPSPGAPGYTLVVATAELGLTTERAGRTVLATAAGPIGALRFRSGGRWQHATRVTHWTWRDGTLALDADSTLAGTAVTARITPSADRYRLDWSVTGAAPDRLGLVYDLRSAGHWYGHGETRTPRGGPTTDQPWPLDSGQVEDPDFGPASYFMVDPFWFTQSATGLRVDTGSRMDVSINAPRTRTGRGSGTAPRYRTAPRDGAGPASGPAAALGDTAPDGGRTGRAVPGDGLGRFTVDSPGPYRATVFVESTPRAVYRDYVGLVGRPARSHPGYRQFREPLWDTWAQFYTRVTERKLLGYAAELRRNGLDGHAVQLDDRWESAYGNLTFDPATFPHPRAMSDALHRLGFQLGLWVTLWINHDSANYPFAARHGYLLRDGADPHRPCTVHWWNGAAGIVDLANPRARAWYEGNLRRLMTRDGIDGLKFDTRFFDGACAPDRGRSAADYQRLGAALAGRYDLQGAGIRVHWSSAAHRAGFATREVDKGTGWDSLRASVSQDLALSSIGYPFVESDVIGGSGGQAPPTGEVLVRWAEAASLMPLMYASTSPVETNDLLTGRQVRYDRRIAELFRAAIRRHERLAPYLWQQVRAAVRTGDPVMRPLFFDFPQDAATYPVADEWLLGPAVLAAPQLGPRRTRTVVLPPGRWYDVTLGAVRSGPATLRGYPAPLGGTPVFVRLGAPGAAAALAALRPGAAPPPGPAAPHTPDAQRGTGR